MEYEEAKRRHKQRLYNLPTKERHEWIKAGREDILIIATMTK